MPTALRRLLVTCLSVACAAGCWRADLAPDVQPGATLQQAPLVDPLTPEAAAGGWIAAVNLSDGPIIASIGDRVLPLEVAGTVSLWWLPPDLPIGPAEVLFQDAWAASQRAGLAITEPWLVDVAEASGLGAAHDIAGWSPDCARSLTAVGVADVDLDGDLDLLQGNLTAPSRLYLNHSEPGRVAFEPSRPGALPDVDLVTAVQFADWDGDGDPDLFLGRRGDNRLLRNDLDEDGPRFVDVTAGSGLAALSQRTTSGGWGDMDADGDLDLYEVNHAWCLPGSPEAPRNEDHLYRNLGDGRFEEVTAELSDAEGQVSRRFGFAALWLDFDGDGTQDLWVVNDHVPAGGRSVLWRNDGLGGALRMEDITDASGVAPYPDALGKATNAMGGAVGDVNGDGLPDLAYSNIGQNFLLHSDGPGRWRGASAERRVERSLLPWGDRSITWGTHLLDLDNDGDLDLMYVGGALVTDRPQPHALFEDQGDGPMVDVSWRAGVAAPGAGHASAQADLDGDGWIDLVVANWGAPMEVWHNRLGDRMTHHWLALDLQGDGVAVNRDAYGAVVALERVDGTVATCFRNAMPSMSSTGDPTCHFGLGGEREVRGVTVTWPDGQVDTVAVDAVDRRLRIVRER